MISFVKKEIFIILLLFAAIHIVFGQYYSGEGPMLSGCFTPDYTQGLCVPMSKCRRIERLLQSCSSPYPVHIARYIRQSYCGSQGDVHYSCCAFYDIKDHHNYSQQPPQIPMPSPSPSFIRNPVYANNKSLNRRYVKMFTSDPMEFQSQPRISYLRQPVGENILRSLLCGFMKSDSVANGDNVHVSQFPWMVLLDSGGVKANERFRCAGTLITHQYVLTAAHCVESRNEVISLRLGAHDLSHKPDCENNQKSSHDSNCTPSYEDAIIESIIVHPDYTLEPLQNDVALIRMQRPVEFKTNIKPICLPLDVHTRSQKPKEQMIAGWGGTERGYASGGLLKAKVSLHPLDVCQKHFPQNRINTREFLCAVAVKSDNACSADFGGPLFAMVPHESHRMRRYVQFGITSAYSSTACNGRNNSLPGIYSNVGNYITWIIGTIY